MAKEVYRYYKKGGYFRETITSIFVLFVFFGIGYFIINYGYEYKDIVLLFRGTAKQRMSDEERLYLMGLMWFLLSIFLAYCFFKNMYINFKYGNDPVIILDAVSLKISDYKGQYIDVPWERILDYRTHGKNGRYLTIQFWCYGGINEMRNETIQYDLSKLTRPPHEVLSRIEQFYRQAQEALDRNSPSDPDL